MTAAEARIQPENAIDAFFAGKPPGPIPNSVWVEGCYLEAYFLNKQVYFGGIWVPPESRGQGLASRLLQEFLAVMDRYGMSTFCHAAPFDNAAPGLGSPALSDWYQRHGFTPDPTVYLGLIRPPKPSPRNV